MSNPQLSLNNISRDDKVQRWHAAALVGYVASIDARVQTTDATVDVWEEALGGAPFGLIRDTIMAHFLAYKNQDYKPVIDPADIRAHARRQMHTEQTRQRSIAGPPKRKGNGPPRWFIERMQQKHGMFTDRNPEDYDPR